MQDGLYGFAYTNTDIVRTCRFPYGSAQCRKTLARLRRTDPPDADCGIPEVPIGTIAAEDRIVAYHFLVRATFWMLRTTIPQTAKATPYLMAFSTLSQVRFACVAMHATPEGVSILPTQIAETDITKVQSMFQTIQQTIH